MSSDTVRVMDVDVPETDKTMRAIQASKMEGVGSWYVYYVVGGNMGEYAGLILRFGADIEDGPDQYYWCPKGTSDMYGAYDSLDGAIIELGQAI